MRLRYTQEYAILVYSGLSNGMDPILVTCNVNPDLDGFAGAIAYGELLKATATPALVGIFGEPHVEPKFVMERCGFRYPEPVIVHSEQFKKIILVDASDLHLLDKRLNPTNVIEVIDHREVHDAHNFPYAIFQMEMVAAASTMIAERFQEAGVEPSLMVASLMYCAIISNTLNFKAKVASTRDYAAKEWLEQYTKLPSGFFNLMFKAKSDVAGTHLQSRLQDNFSYFVFGRTKVGIGQLEIIGARAVAETRTSEILQFLHHMKPQFVLDHVFLSVIDLEDNTNYFVTDDSETQSMLHDVLDLSFSGPIAMRPESIMRKETVPLIKVYVTPPV